MSPVRAGTFTNDFNKFDPSNPVGGTLNGNANDPTVYDDSSGGVDNTGCLKLTLAINSQQSTYVLNDLDNGKPIGGFTARFKLLLGGGTARPADGFSFSFARASDGVIPSGSVGEEGTGTGIVVEFDTWDNGNEAPALDIKVDGTEIARTKMDGTVDGSSGAAWVNTPVFKDPSGKPFSLETGNAFEDVIIDYRDGLLSVNYKGVDIYKNLLVPVAPFAGQFVLGARTGGANDNTFIDNLGITTYPPSTVPVISAFNGGPSGVSIDITDGVSALNSSSVKLTFDGATVTPTVTKNGSITTIQYTTPALLAPSSAHSATLVYSDNGTPVTTKTVDLPFTVPNYTALPGSLALSSGVDKTKAGFRIRPYQVDGSQGTQPNTLAWTEEQLAGVHGPNIADLSGADSKGFYTVTGVMNFDIAGPDGNFTDANGFPDKPFPGFPGTGGGTDNTALEALFYLEFPAAGVYTLGVNSDDGFRVSTAANPLDKLATPLGQFDGGRGAADTLFTVVVTQAGIYPMRLIWENGGGGANLEFFSVNGSKKILINDTTTAGHLNAYSAGPAGPAYVKSVSPGFNATDVLLSAKINVVVTDADTQVDPASVKVKLDGADLAATATKSGLDTTITAAPANGFGVLSKHSVSLTYSDKSTPAVVRTVNWTFTTGALGAPGTLFIEAEDFNFGHGKTITDKPIGMTGKYPGGAFDGLGDGVGGTLGDGSDLGIDYNEVNTGSDQAVYRPNTGVEAGKKDEPGESNRGDFDVDVNYIVGWNDAGDWYNYTRTFPTPDKYYNVYGRLASGGAAINAELDEVTSAATTATQTTKKIGVFRPGRATAGWDSFETFPLIDDIGNQIAYKVGGVKTLRFTTLPGNVDFDYMMFVPAAVQAAPPVVAISSPATPTAFPTGTPVSLTATATTADGTITKVEFFAGTNKVGEATSSPFTTTVSTLATGFYNVSAKATASNGLTTMSPSVRIAVGNVKPQALFVVATGGALNASDTAIRNHLLDLGYDVTVVGDTASQTSDADLKTLIITSSEVGSGNVGNKFQSVAVPVVNWEQALQDNYLFTTDEANVTRGSTTGMRDIIIAKADHPLAAGLPAGKVTVATADAEFSWGVPAKEAVIIATMSDDPTHATIYAFEKGATFIDGTTKAPARRVHFLMTDNTYAVLNDTGKKLFDAAVNWAVGGGTQPAGPKLTVSKSGNNITISWTGAGTLQKADKVTGPWTDVTGASPQTQPIAGQARFFRVKQ